MQLTIKRYEAKEEEQLKQLLYFCFEEEVFINVINGSRLKFAFSALYENKLVGMVFAWTSSFHPYCTYFRILSNPFYNGLHIEEELVSKVHEQKIKTSPNLPLQTSVWETSVNLNRVYKNNGFREIRRTYMPNLKVSDVVHCISYHSEEHKIITLAEILSDETLLEKLTLLVKRTYEKTHTLNPVGEIEIEQWKRMLLADDILSDGSYIYLDNDEKNIIAYTFLHESDRENSFELGWCGAADIKNKGLILHLIYYQAKYAMKHNKQFIGGEFDTTDIYAMEVMGSFPFAPCPAWITYQKE